MDVVYRYEPTTERVVGREAVLPYASIHMSSSGSTSVTFSDGYYPTVEQKERVAEILSKYLYNEICDRTFVNLVTSIRLALEPEILQGKLQRVANLGV